MRTDSRGADLPCTLTVLGSCGWMPTLGRQTSSVLLRRGNDALLLDAGSGWAHLPHHQGLLAGVENLAIVLTHFHADHVIGLTYAGGLGFPVPSIVFGPGRMLYGVGTKKILGSFVGRPTTHARLDDLWPDIRDLDSMTPEVAGFALELRAQHRHTAPTLAIRVEDMAAYITDTGYDADNGAFAAGVQLVVHEAWWHRTHPDCTETHSSGQDAGRVAAAAGAPRLALVHLHPAGDHEAVLAEASEQHSDVQLSADVLTNYTFA